MTFLEYCFFKLFFAKSRESRIFPITNLVIFFWPVAFLYFQEKINEIDQQIKAKESEINTLTDEAASLKTEQQEIVLELQERKKAVKDKQVDIIFFLNRMIGETHGLIDGQTTPFCKMPNILELGTGLNLSKQAFVSKCISWLAQRLEINL